MVASRPDAKVSAIKNQIKGVMRFVKEGSKTKWQKYALSTEGIGLVVKE